jgi:hypothetical protein
LKRVLFKHGSGVTSGRDEGSCKMAMACPHGRSVLCSGGNGAERKSSALRGRSGGVKRNVEKLWVCETEQKRIEGAKIFVCVGFGAEAGWLSGRSRS